MSLIRIISRLDIKATNVVKGIHLEGLRVVGKPAELAQKYYQDGVDEILFMDIVASLYGRNSILSVIEETANQVFVPLTVGGGIRTLEDIQNALLSGADKVAINTAAIKKPSFLKEAAEAFGSQCIVLSVEAKRRGPNKWEALTDNGREKTGVDVLEWIIEGEKLGVGEVLVTSVDQEGTRKGFDLELMDCIYKSIDIPVIACGGAGGVEDVEKIMDLNCADAVCCASIFHYETCTLKKLKNDLAAHGKEVRI